MKKILIILFAFIQRYIYSYNSYLWLKQKCNEIRSYWLRCLFAQCPRSVRFGSTDWLKGLQYITIGEKTKFEDGLTLTAWDSFEGAKFKPTIQIGSNCSFGRYNHITSCMSIIIGNNVLTGKWVTISDNNHGDTSMDCLQTSPLKRQLKSKGIIVIGDNVWIGDKCTILSGVTIGKGAVIAANSVVTKDVDPFSVVGGIPAKRLLLNNCNKSE